MALVLEFPVVSRANVPGILQELASQVEELGKPMALLCVYQYEDHEGDPCLLVRTAGPLNDSAHLACLASYAQSALVSEVLHRGQAPAQPETMPSGPACA